MQSKLTRGNRLRVSIGGREEKSIINDLSYIRSTQRRIISRSRALENISTFRERWKLIDLIPARGRPFEIGPNCSQYPGPGIE